MKRILISPYFGKMPNYFQIFLDSCAYNDDFCDFLIITDDTTQFDVPKNVKFLSMSFEEFNELTKQKLGSEFGVSSAYKICDYRPAFGKIFEEHLVDYDFWGHVDVDMVLGRLSHFLSDEVFENNDRVLERGALMFYRNTETINELFLQVEEGIINFQDAVNMKEPCFYDEIMFPELLLKAGHKTYSNLSYADILPQHLRFAIDGHCSIKNRLNQYFVLESSIGLFQEAGEDNDGIECMYLHIQKRPMRIQGGVGDNLSKLYIQENYFAYEFKDGFILRKDELIWRLRYMRRQLQKLDWNHIRIHIKTRVIRRRIKW